MNEELTTGAAEHVVSRRSLSGKSSQADRFLHSANILMRAGPQPFRATARKRDFVAHERCAHGARKLHSETLMDLGAVRFL